MTRGPAANCIFGYTFSVITPPPNPRCSQIPMSPTRRRRHHDEQRRRRRPLSSSRCPGGSFPLFLLAPASPRPCFSWLCISLLITLLAADCSHASSFPLAHACCCAVVHGRAPTHRLRDGGGPTVPSRMLKNVLRQQYPPPPLPSPLSSLSHRIRSSSYQRAPQPDPPLVHGAPSSRRVPG